MKNSKIQIIRGIAIICVVCIHCLPQGDIQVYIRPFINFGVATFLFLSGYLTKNEKYNIKNRFLKVIIPYIVWTIIYTILFDYKNMSNAPLDILTNLITTNSAPMMYFVFVYCELTVLLPAISKLAFSKYKYLGFIVSPLEIILLRLLPLFFDVHFSKYFVYVMNISFVPWFIFYYLGYLIGNKIISIKLNKLLLIVMLVFSIVVQVAEGYLYYCLGNTTNPGTQLKLSSLLTNVIIMLLISIYICTKDNSKFRLLIIFGDCSFGIFFIHYLVLIIVSKVPFYDSFLFFPFNALLVFLCSLLLVLVGKKILGKGSKYLGF